jgi:flagellum-specific peptidoglycan hydrolase FlgJ
MDYQDFRDAKKNIHLHVAAKDGQPTEQGHNSIINGGALHFDPLNYDGRRVGLFDHLIRFFNGFQQVWTVCVAKFHGSTFGVFRLVRYRIVKIGILGIIIYAIWHEDLDFSQKAVIFASKSKHERIYTPTKTVGAVAAKPVSFGNGASNPFAPASPDELHEQEVREYITQFSPIAIQEMDKFGIPASISMAQGIVESRAGKSILAQKNNNQFGIKCFSRSCPKGHCTNFTDDHHKDFFRKYDSPAASWREHSQFLMKNRYHSLLQYGKNYRAWAQGLRELGYATDQSYDRKLIAVIERYGLQKLDNWR